MKKKICFCIILILLFNTTVVYASESETSSSSVSSADAYKQFLSDAGLRGMFGQLCAYVGAVFNDTFDADAIYKYMTSVAAKNGYLSYEDFVKDNYNNNNTPDDLTDDYIDISKEFVNSFNVQINNYVKDNYGYEVYPACTQNDTWVLNHMKYFNGVTSKASQIADIYANNDTVFLFSRNTGGSVCVLSQNDVYLVNIALNPANTVIPVWVPYNSNCDRLEWNWFGVAGYSGDDKSYYWGSHTYYPADKSPVDGNGNTLYYRFTKDTKVFNSLEALNNYLYGEKMVYQISSVNKKITSLTFNLKALKSDWEKINEESLQAILDAIANKKLDLEVDTLTEEELQIIIDTTISARLDEIKKAISDGDQMNQFQNQLIYEKLEQIFQLLKSWDKSGNDEVDNIVNDKLEIDFTSVTDALKDILDELKLIKDSIDDIDVTNITNNTFNTDFDINIVLQLQPAIDKMKGTFPFCIPWDIYACIHLLAHEPEAPHWVLPFRTPVGDYEVDIDLSSMQMLSDISRSLLSLLFILYLSRLTMSIWRML